MKKNFTLLLYFLLFFGCGKKQETVATGTQQIANSSSKVTDTVPSDLPDKIIENKKNEALEKDNIVTKEQKTVERSAPVDGRIVGKWYEGQYTSATFIIFEKGSKYFLKQIYKDGSSVDEELVRKKSGNLVRFDYKKKLHGEYFILGENGDLMLYNKEGKNFTIDQKISI